MQYPTTLRHVLCKSVICGFGSHSALATSVLQAFERISSLCASRPGSSIASDTLLRVLIGIADFLLSPPEGQSLLATQLSDPVLGTLFDSWMQVR